VEVCTRCHQAERLYSSKNLGCFFSTGREWASSSYVEAGQTCQSCDMSEVDRELSAGFGMPSRRTRRHWFGGSLVPKKLEYEHQIAPLREVYGNGLTLSVRQVTPELQALAVQTPPLAPEDQKVAVSKEVSRSRCREPLVVVIANDQAGHDMPTGDPERHVDVAVTVRLRRQIVARAWTRIGSRYQWWPEVKLLADTRISPGRERVLVVASPSDGTVEISATKARMYEEAFEYHHLQGQYVRAREFFHQKMGVSDILR